VLKERLVAPVVLQTVMLGCIEHEASRRRHGGPVLVIAREALTSILDSQRDF
jgi:hypothetical protein